MYTARDGAGNIMPAVVVTTSKDITGEYIGCHGKIIIADCSFTEDEITWLKDNWKKIYGFK